MFLVKTCLENTGLFYSSYFQNYQYNSANLYHKICYIIQLKYMSQTNITMTHYITKGINNYIDLLKIVTFYKKIY